ncbi:MAG: RHS repeat-associated core domain-containing protein [Phycisphaerales bacterium]
MPGDDAYVQLVDSSMSVVAHVDALTGQLRQRMSYDAFGRMRLILNADIDGNGRVDEDDLSIFASQYTYEVGDDARPKTTDFNGDGVVDDADLSLFAQWYDDQAGDKPTRDVVRVAYHGYIPEHATLMYIGDESRMTRYLGRMRWYDARLGRWLTRDPAGYVDGLNVYLFVGGNPLMFVDPTGLSWLAMSYDAQLGGGGSVGGGFSSRGVYRDSYSSGHGVSALAPGQIGGAPQIRSPEPVREAVEPAAAVLNHPVTKNMLAGAQAVGGGAATIIGASTAKLGVGIPLALWGIDQAQSGVRYMLTQEDSSTVGGAIIGMGLEAVGVSEEAASFVGEAAYGLAGSATARASTNAASKVVNHWLYRGQAPGSPKGIADSVYAAVGQLTVSNKLHQRYKHLSDPIERGRAIVTSPGIAGLVMNLRPWNAARTGKGGTLLTGPTRPARVFIERATHTAALKPMLDSDFEIERDYEHAREQ